MSAVIENALQQKFAAIEEASQRASFGPVQQYAQRYHQEIPDVDIGRLESVQSLASMSVGSRDDLTRLCTEAEQSIPGHLWNSVLVCCDPSSRPSEIESFAVETGIRSPEQGRLRTYFDKLGMAAVRIPPSRHVLQFLGDLPGVTFLGDGSRRVPSPPPQASRAEPVGPLEAMHRCMIGDRPLPRDFDVTGTTLRIGVIDSGIDRDHPMIGPCVEKRVDLSESGTGACDPDGHGTHVAGIIAGQPHSENPLWGGIAPFARLTDILVWSPLGTSSLVVVAGIGCAVDNNLHLFNLSMGTPLLAADATSIESVAVERAAEQGVLGCVAAGNTGDQGPGRISVPSDAPSAVAVAAVDADGRWAPFSSQGPSADPDRTGTKPTVAAPGVSILSLKSSCHIGDAADPDMLYTVMSGTSMAAPMMTGVCALGIADRIARGSVPPTPEEVRNALRTSAVDPAGEGANKLGAGIPQVPAFLDVLREKDNVVVSSHSGTADFAQSYLETVTPDAHQVESSDRNRGTSPGGIEMPPKRASAAATSAGSIDRERRHATPAPVTAPREKKPSDNTNFNFALDAEAAFVTGVQRNLERFAEMLGVQITGVGGGRIASAEMHDEENRVLDELARTGCSENIPALPRNLEFSATVMRRRNHKLLRVVAKSFAGWQTVGEIASGHEGLTAARINAYLEQKRNECPGIPVVVSALTVGAWPPEVSGTSFSGNDVDLLLCTADPTCKDGFWVDLKTEDVPWAAWLALTPMSWEARKNYCTDRLLSSGELSHPGGTLGMDEAAQRVGLPQHAAVELILNVCLSDHRLGVLPADGPAEFVKREKMR